jgi:transcriptional regulator with XRE-family HTH domain
MAFFFAVFQRVAAPWQRPGRPAIPWREWQIRGGFAKHAPVAHASERSELATALRGWRGRRRVSQLELALNAGTTQRHVSFIESGRPLPGRGMVLRLAEALELPLRERNALLLAAGYAPAYEETRLNDPKLGPVLAALERILDGHLPYPAVTTNRHGDLVSGNRAFWALTQGAAEDLLAPPVSIPRLLLHPSGMAPRILNLDVWAWHVLDALRREAVRNPNQRLEALLAELRAVSARSPASSDAGLSGIRRSPATSPG